MIHSIEDNENSRIGEIIEVGSDLINDCDEYTLQKKETIYKVHNIIYNSINTRELNEKEDIISARDGKLFKFDSYEKYDLTSIFCNKELYNAIIKYIESEELQSKLEDVRPIINQIRKSSTTSHGEAQNLKSERTFFMSDPLENKYSEKPDLNNVRLYDTHKINNNTIFALDYDSLQNKGGQKFLIISTDDSIDKINKKLKYLYSSDFDEYNLREYLIGDNKLYNDGSEVFDDIDILDEGIKEINDNLGKFCKSNISRYKKIRWILRKEIMINGLLDSPSDT
jgi:hypothetical protein